MTAVELVPLGELVDAGGGLIRTGPFGSQLHQADYTSEPGATPVIMPKDMIDGRVRVEGIARVARTKVEELAHHQLVEGDIVLARRGDVGRCAWIGTAEAGYLCGTGSIRVSVGSGHLHPRFLFHALLSDGCRSWLERQAVGATMPNLNADIVRQLPVPTLSMANQRRVSDVLDSFEELIDNDGRRIEVLQQSARTLYQEWFVEGRAPGDASATLVAALGSVALWLSGGTPSTAIGEYWGGDIPWITSGSLTSFVLRDSERRLTVEGAAAGSRLVERDSLLFVVRGMSLAKEFRRGIADRQMAFGQDCKALVAKPHVDPLFLAFAVDAIAATIEGMVEYAAHGTGKLSTDRLQALEIPAPPPELQAEFANRVRPLRELISVLAGEADRLRVALDLVLPRLVTGTMDVESLGVDDVFGWTELAEASVGP